MAFGKSLVETGVAYLTKGQYDRAIECYDEAIRIDPKNSGLFALRGSAYASKGSI
ncbi:MAG: tetratricopeptide repeat protein [Deltaproteobacteria bacterium]